MNTRWELAIDLGTAFVRMADAEKGIVVNEPAYIAVHDNGTPVCFGETAYTLCGREPEGITVGTCLKNGTLENPEYANLLIRYLMRRLDGDRRKRHSLLLSYSPLSRGTQSDALMNAALDAGASDVALVRSDAVGALGSGVDILSPKATFVIDMGAGKISATLFSLGREVAYKSLSYGMNVINDRIIDMLRREAGFHIGFQTAEELKISLASAHHGDVPSYTARAAGYNAETRMPAIMELAPEPVLKICAEPLNELINMCRDVIVFAPEELSADLNDCGAILTGGGAALPGIDKLISDNLHMPCTIAESPATCAIKGLHSMLLESGRYEMFIDRRMAIAEKR